MSRRQTRSMGDVESLSTPKDELELSLEEELLEVSVTIYYMKNIFLPVVFHTNE